MDRSMKSSRLTKAEWDALLARIQTPSKELEATLAKSSTNLIEALSGLEELEKLTRMHLAPPAPALPPAPATPAASAAPIAPIAPSVKYQTSREEYAPALHQSALVEALLQYQRKKALRSPNSKPAPQSKAAANSPSSAPAAPEFAKADFAPMRIPAIETEPKASPLGRLDAPSVRLPVLRLKPSGNSNGNEQS